MKDSNGVERQPVQFTIKHDVPHGWIQWKGTEVCVDIHCKCGQLSHFDGDFMYAIQCPHCKQIYECDGHIQLHPLDYKPDHFEVAD